MVYGCLDVLFKNLTRVFETARFKIERFAPLARLTNVEIVQKVLIFLGGFPFLGCVKLANLRLTFQCNNNNLKYTLSDIVAFFFQSQIQICCAFFKWSNSSTNNFFLYSLYHALSLVWSGAENLALVIVKIRSILGPRGCYLFFLNTICLIWKETACFAK